MIQVISKNKSSLAFWKTIFPDTTIKKVSRFEDKNSQYSTTPTIFLIDNYFQSPINLQWMLGELINIKNLDKQGRVYCISPSFTEQIRSQFGMLEIVESQLSYTILKEIQNNFIEAENN